MITRRSFMRTAIAASTVLLTPFNLFASPKKIKIGVLAPSHCALPVLFAGAKHYFKHNDLNVEIIFKKETTDIVKGIASKELDFGQVISPVALAVNEKVQGFPDITLKATQVLGTNGGVLGISSTSRITKLKDLKGKTIGVHSPFMVHSLILNSILEKSGLTPGRDVMIKVLPMNEMAASIKQGTIDGFINPEPLPTVLESNKTIRSLLLTRLFWPNHPCCLLVTSKQTYDNEKNLVTDLATAVMIAGYTIDNPVTRKESIELVYHSFAPYQKLPLHDLFKAFEPRRSDFYPFLYSSSIEFIIQQMQKSNLISQTADNSRILTRLMDPEFNMQLAKNAASQVPGAIAPKDISRKEQILVI